MPKKSILIIDDDPQIVMVLRDRLEANNYKVLTAGGGQEGLEQAKQMPDAILLDLIMPGMDGFEVAQKLKEDKKTKDIPIIVLTAKGERSAVERAFDFGVKDYVVKPVNPGLFIEKIKKVLHEVNNRGGRA